MRNFIDEYTATFICLCILFGSFLLAYLGVSAYYMDLSSYFNSLKLTLLFNANFRVITTIIFVIQIIIISICYHQEKNSERSYITDAESICIVITVILNLVLYIAFSILFTH